MNIRILHMVPGAREATGLTVIIDVFRAMTVETYLMRNNARRIIPVGDMQIAFDYKAQHPENTVLCGERKGIMIEGFDFGNSPSQLEGVDLTGKTVIHTTSAGTRRADRRQSGKRQSHCGVYPAKESRNGFPCMHGSQRKGADGRGQPLCLLH